MNKFFDDEEEKEEEQEVQKIKLGDKEFTEDELKSYVDKGNKVDEYEKKYNTSFDKAWSAYGRTTQENSELKTKLTDLESKINQPVIPTNADMDPVVKAQAIEAAKKLGLVTKEDLSSVPNKEVFKEWYQEQRQAEKLLDEMESLEGKINGSDGRPAFKTDEVLSYMQSNGVSNPMAAYKIMHEESLDKWKESKLKESRGRGFVTETQGGGTGDKRPSEVKVTKDNIEDLLAEALGQ